MSVKFQAVFLFPLSNKRNSIATTPPGTNILTPNDALHLTISYGILKGHQCIQRM